MTYRAAAALQGAVYQRLSTWAGLNGVAVVDAVPPGTGTGTFILLGPEQANDESDGSGAGVAHSWLSASSPMRRGLWRRKRRERKFL